MTTPRTLFDKIWVQHVITQREGEALLYIDRNFVHEGAFHAFGALGKEGRKVRRPRQTFATADHYVPTVGRERGIAGITDREIRGMVELLEHNTQCLWQKRPKTLRITSPAIVAITAAPVPL